MSSTGLEGRTVVITGGGSGIGRAAAFEFADAGAKVLVADRNKDAARQVVKTIEYSGGFARDVVGDVSDPGVVDEVVSTAVGTFGGLDVLVNNAGVRDRMSSLADTGDAEWEEVMRVSLTAPFLMTRAALPHMMAAGGGSIVFAASEAGLRGSAAGAAYTAAKHGIVGLTRNVAVMYRTHGIRANAVAAGPTITSFAYETNPKAHGPSVVRPYIGLSGKIAEAEEQAAAIVFLASDAASNINGAILPCDFGWAAI